jgi:uncharacterized protein (DUF4415 family)
MTRSKGVTTRWRQSRTKVRSGETKGKSKTQTGKGRRRSLSLMASAEDPKPRYAVLEKLLNQYRPLKKPVTMRVDADVLDWFKRGGQRYQTRINQALRKVMVQEMKAQQEKHR